MPKGNPDGQTSGNAQKYFRYPIDQLQALRSGENFVPEFVNEDED